MVQEGITMIASYVRSMKYHALMTPDEHRRLVENGSIINSGRDHKPVIKLHIPMIGSAWLLTEIMPVRTNIAFGLCDMGLGSPEIGYVNLDEFLDILDRTNLTTLRDNAFTAMYPLSTYKNAANYYGQVITDDKLLKPFILKHV
jgi:hypothetical protein